MHYPSDTLCYTIYRPSIVVIHNAKQFLHNGIVFVNVFCTKMTKYKNVYSKPPTCDKTLCAIQHGGTFPPPRPVTIRAF